jgi:hypothetical protein
MAGTVKVALPNEPLLSLVTVPALVLSRKKVTVELALNPVPLAVI